MEISSGELVDAVARSQKPSVADELGRSLTSIGNPTHEVDKTDRASLAAIYEVRLAASRAGRGPKTEGFETFVESLRSAAGPWIYWVTFTDDANVLWYVTLDAAASKAGAVFKVFDEPLPTHEAVTGCSPELG